MSEKIQVTEEKIIETVDALFELFCENKRENVEAIHEILKDKNLYDKFDEVDYMRGRNHLMINDYIKVEHNLKINRENSFILFALVQGEFQDFLERYICENEGSGMSADKTRHIIKMVIKQLETGEHQTLKSYYKRGDFPNEEHDIENEGKEAYWSPQTLNDTEELYTIYLNYLNLTRDILKKDTLSNYIKE